MVCYDRGGQVLASKVLRFAWDQGEVPAPQQQRYSKRGKDPRPPSGRVLFRREGSLPDRRRVEALRGGFPPGPGRER